MKTILVDAVHCFVLPWEWIYQDMYKLLETYENPKLILTWANDEEMDNFWLHDMPYPVFTLKHTPEKTDPQYYKTFFEEHWLSVDDVVYFENSLEATESAKSVWITTYHYDRDTKDLVTLKEFLDQHL